jgi:hypothetical protein
MWLLILEALAALSLLIFAVWWTMFSGRRRSEDANAEETHGADAVEGRPGPPPDKDRA